MVTKENLSAEEMIAIWEAHIYSEFEEKNVDNTMRTMVEGAYVNNVPTMIGGVGLSGVRAFYTDKFIPGIPPDTQTEMISRTVGQMQLVEEQIFKCTHSIPMPWMLPGIAPTHRRIEVPLVAVVGFREGKVAHEHIYWDQASVLVQVGLLDAKNLPVASAQCPKIGDHPA